jgi:hypothetical protein
MRMLCGSIDAVKVTIARRESSRVPARRVRSFGQILRKLFRMGWLRAWGVTGHCAGAVRCGPRSLERRRR